jgi:hypothetical protein
MITQFSWSPDGTRISYLRDTLTGLADGSELILWETGDSEELMTLVDGVFSIRWIP